MAANSASLRLISAACLLLLIASSAAASDSAHDLLKKFGLPKGLLPHSVKEYRIAVNGSFEVRLKKPCYVKFEDIVYYDESVRGKIEYGVISGIRGIQVRKFFVWFPITDIVADEDEKTIKFRVGFLSETFPAKMFKDIPDCIKEDDLSRDADGSIHEESLPVAEV